MTGLPGPTQKGKRSGSRLQQGALVGAAAGMGFLAALLLQPRSKMERKQRRRPF